MKKLLFIMIAFLLVITSCNIDMNDVLDDDRWGVEVVSYKTVESYEYDGIPWEDNIAYPEDGYTFLEVTATVRNKDSVYHPFGGAFGEGSSLYIRSSSSPIYEDKSQKNPMEPSVNIDGGGSHEFTWYYEIPENADLSQAYISVYGPEVQTVTAKLNK